MRVEILHITFIPSACPYIIVPNFTILNYLHSIFCYTCRLFRNYVLQTLKSKQLLNTTTHILSFVLVYQRQIHLVTGTFKMSHFIIHSFTFQHSGQLFGNENRRHKIIRSIHRLRNIEQSVEFKQCKSYHLNMYMKTVLYVVISIMVYDI